MSAPGDLSSNRNGDSAGDRFLGSLFFIFKSRSLKIPSFIELLNSVFVDLVSWVEIDPIWAFNWLHCLVFKWVFFLKNLKNSTVAPFLLIQSGGVALWQFKSRAEPLQLYCRSFPFYTERQWRTVSLCSLRRSWQTFGRTVQSDTERQCRTMPLCSPRQYKNLGFLKFCFQIF